MELIRFLRCKITRTSFLFALCIILCVLICTFYKNLIALHHGDNNFLFYFNICIKFTLSLIILTMKEWQHLAWCVPFCDKNMLEWKKTFHHSKIKRFKYLKSLNEKDNKIKDIPLFGKFVTVVLIFRSSRSQIFFKVGVPKYFAKFTEKNLYWPLHAFFYRTHTLTPSGFLRQQILFSVESGIYCWQSHLFLLRTPPKLLC